MRVYLSNVETLARKFVEEKREALLALRADSAGFLAFWAAMDPRRRRQMATASGEVLLKVGCRAMPAPAPSCHIVVQTCAKASLWEELGPMKAHHCCQVAACTHQDGGLKCGMLDAGCGEALLQ